MSQEPLEGDYIPSGEQSFEEFYQRWERLVFVDIRQVLLHPNCRCRSDIGIYAKDMGTAERVQPLLLEDKSK